MRIARVIGTVTLSRKLDSLRPGRYVVADVLDAQAVAGMKTNTPRKTPMPESLIVFDELGVGIGQIIAVSEGREAACPFYPGNVPIDAYASAILDTVDLT